MAQTDADAKPSRPHPWSLGVMVVENGLRLVLSSNTEVGSATKAHTIHLEAFDQPRRQRRADYSLAACDL